MSIFVSYSHKDAEFATNLARLLVLRNAHVWIDKWELRVGDSILDRIEAAITSASALIVILSKHSVDSQWCKKEITGGLLRELEERRVVVLPVLLDDCPIPLFLRDKKYADFRSDFDVGLRDVIEAVARFSSNAMRRVDQSAGKVDWSLSWGIADKLLRVDFVILEWSREQPYSVLTVVCVLANEAATRRYNAFESERLGWLQRVTILELILASAEEKDVRLLIEDEKPKEFKMTIVDPRTHSRFDVLIETRKMGDDTGKDLLVDIAGQLRTMKQSMKEGIRPMTEEEAMTVARRIAALQAQF